MEAWQARRLCAAREALDEFIAKCEDRIAKIEQEREQAMRARRELSAIEDFDKPRAAPRRRR